MAETPNEPEVDLGIDDRTPLQDVVAEVHEMYGELIDIGFTADQGLQIVAHMLYDVMTSRFAIDDDDEDDDDEDDINNGGTN
jgi:hypothetical protein